ncbi:uncharacterized protein LOC118736947 [Rhagoletis pomonella]|uniref:uncharacterized protein LOC118736947 n=1 Tax=Rhagoletis pomonella TaxID=28610 RepID=UPI001780873A|nr:uncharacterized protein LOC118736947 [Rhagoletis pomonella]XP_036323008.1 uncharacterized protein LOC118736947 [Rhagoletis pomonella]
MPKIPNFNKPIWLLHTLFFLILCRATLTLAKSDTSTQSQQQIGSNYALKGKLILAHVLYRHGDRTPIEPYPTDPWKKREYWPVGWGELTNVSSYRCNFSFDFPIVR